MKTDVQQLYSTLMGLLQKPDSDQPPLVEVSINPELSTRFVKGGRWVWLVTCLGSWPEHEVTPAETESVMTVLQAILANAADYHDSVSVDESGGLLLQRAVAVDGLSEESLLDAFEGHRAFARYLFPLLGRDEPKSWQGSGVVHP